ncbi:MAG: hypothetical protein E7241_09810 [Lachnospiraceae bacterium]|jgi:hypothetical protein|nr:hypothetical protein [Lachnospiraceae bacterium]
MELQSLNKEYKLVRQENEDKFLQLHQLNPDIVIVEEYWITSDHTLGNRCAFFESFIQAEEYAYLLASNRNELNENKKKPFAVFVNGKEVKTTGFLQEYLDGKFEI